MKPRRPPKPRPKNRSELLARERDVWHELHATWRGLSSRVLAQPGASGNEWSVKDVMNHIAAWQEAALRVIPELMKGNRATLGSSVNKFNAIQRETDRARTVIASQRRLHRVRRQLLSLLAAVPDDALIDPTSRINWWVKYTTYSHYGEHIYELTQFRKRVAK